MRNGFRWLLAAAGAVELVFDFAALGHADPPQQGPDPFPDMSVIKQYYTEISPDEFYIPDHAGVWFLSPSGLNCGIWPWGSFGCAGDIPGAPPGDNHIAWFNGNRAVHHGWTAAMQFPAGQAQRALPPRGFVTFEQSTCAVTPDNNTYCEHGAFKMYSTPQGTWFKGWNDRNSYVCNSYASCPLG